MNDITTLGPELIIEIHRYSKPEDMFAFHNLEPTEDTKRYYCQPFAGEYDADKIDPETGLVKDSPLYIEHAGDLISATARAAMQETLIADGWQGVQLPDLPEHFRHYVIHNQAPIEWHRGLDAGEIEITSRIMVWKRGEFPS